MLNFLGGLLDNPSRAVGINPEEIDPNQRWALRGMTLTALGNQLAGGTNFYDSMGSIAEGIDARQKAELERQQLQAKMEQQRQLGQLFGQDPAANLQANASAAAMAIPTSQAGPVGPTPARASLQQAAVQSVSPAKLRADQYRRAASIVAATSPETAQKYVEIAEKLDPREEFMAPVEADGKFFQPGKFGTARPVEGFTPKPPAAPTSVQEYQYAVSQGYKGTFQQYDIERRKAAANSLTVNTGEKKFVDSLAPAIAQQVAGSAEAAASARSTLTTVAQIRAALPTAITGPGADTRVFITRLQSVLGVGGASDQERLANTQRVLQGLAQTQLNAAQQLQGQGTITDFERALIAKTAGGDLSMTPAEILAALAAVEKVANHRVQTFERNVRNLQNIPGMAPLMPFFAGQGDAVTPPGAAGSPASIQDAARQEMLRRQGGAR